MFKNIQITFESMIAKKKKKIQHEIHSIFAVILIQSKGTPALDVVVIKVHQFVFFWKFHTWPPTWSLYMGKMLQSWLNHLTCLPMRGFLHFQLIIHLWHHQHSCIPLFRYTSTLSLAATKDKRHQQHTRQWREEAHRGRSSAKAK